jgi:D-lyxose ketol-isomerase
MKRSEVNGIMAQADGFIRSFGFVLPPFAFWTPDQFRTYAAGSRIAEAGMGWDITDFGQGQFATLGLFLFTLRNGKLADLQRGGGMCYAEKLLIARRDQVTPTHTHVIKAEDIINRGGATLAVELCGSDANGGYDATAGGVVMCDGAPRPFRGGEVIRLAPGQSVTLLPGDWHAFWGDGGDVLVGEVSTVNDDTTDNVFRDPVGRFAAIEEDAAPLHLLVSDYQRWLRD